MMTQDIDEGMLAFYKELSKHSCTLVRLLWWWPKGPGIVTIPY